VYDEEPTSTLIWEPLDCCDGSRSTWLTEGLGRRNLTTVVVQHAWWCKVATESD